MQLDQIYLNALRTAPDKVAITCGGQICTYQQLDDAVNRQARALMGRGIGHGDRVGLWMHNRMEMIELYLACFRIGAIAVPLPCLYQTPEVIYAAGQSKCRLLLADPDLYPKAQDVPKKVFSLEEVLVVGDGSAPQDASREELVRQAPAQVQWPPVEASDPAALFYTSGTTSRPKGVTHSHQTFYHTAVNKRGALHLTDQDICIVATFISHVHAFAALTLPSLLCGGTVVLLSAFDPGVFLEELIRHRATVGSLLPDQLLGVLEHPQAKKESFQSLRLVLCGGDTVPSHLHELFYNLTGFELTEGIGMTECEGYCLNLPFRKRGSVGRPIQDTEMRLVDASGQDVPRGEVGEILVRSPAVMVGYWNDPENTAKAFLDGWLRTGDLARQDEEGNYYFAGRIKQIIVRASHNIAPGEVENVLDDHPKVKVSGVVGLPDERYGQRVHAFVVPDRDQGAVPTAEELTRFAAARLAHFKVPQSWTFLDQLPLNPSGKIDRRGLQDLAKQHLEI